MTEPQKRYAFIVLIDDEALARHARQLLALSGVLEREDTIVGTPPQRGVAFFSTSDAELDRWWGNAVPQDATPIYLIDDSDELLNWLGSVDGHFVVALSFAQRHEVYQDWPNVISIFPADDLQVVVDIAVKFPNSDMTDTPDAKELSGRRIRRVHVGNARLGASQLDD